MLVVVLEVVAEAAASDDDATDEEEVETEELEADDTEVDNTGLFPSTAELALPSDIVDVANCDAAIVSRFSAADCVNNCSFLICCKTRNT